MSEADERFVAWQALSEAIEQVWPVRRYRDLGVVIACSGGADSVALLRALDERIRQWPSELGPPRGFLVVAHFNHRLRGQASDSDAKFVGELAAELNLPFETAAGDGQRVDEQSARQDRRSFLAQVAKRNGARYIALAHSLDDNVETFLHRLMRGTGPAGLCGIAPFRPLADRGPERDFVLARPMLAVRRQSIRDALCERGFRWREDQSNARSDYRRNWIRNELLPIICSEFPDAVAAISRAIDGQRQWAESLSEFVTPWTEAMVIGVNPLRVRRLDRAGDWAGDLVGLGINSNWILSRAVVTESLRRQWMVRGWPLQSFGQAQWELIYQLLSGSGPDKVTLPGAIELRRHGESVTFSPATQGGGHVK